MLNVVYIDLKCLTQLILKHQTYMRDQRWKCQFSTLCLVTKFRTVEVDAESSGEDENGDTNKACLFNCLLYLVILILCFFDVNAELDFRCCRVWYNDEA